MSSELKTNKISPATGTALTLADSGDTLTLPSGATLDIASGATIDATGATITGWPAAVDNTPSFQAYLSSNQTISDNVWTQINPDTEDFDTDSAYDNSTNYRFTVPSGEGGKYFIYFCGVLVSSGGSSQVLADHDIQIRVNTETDSTARISTTNNVYGGASMYSTKVEGIATLSAGDYVEFYARSNVSSGYNSYFAGGSNLRNTVVGAYKLIGV